MLQFLNAGMAMAQISTSTRTDPISTSNLTSLFLGLVLVLLVFFCMAYVLKKLSGTNANSRGYISVIDAMHIGTREKIVLLKVAGTCMVLGVTSNSIKTLHVLDGELPETETRPVGDFKAKLSGILSTRLKAG